MTSVGHGGSGRDFTFSPCLNLAAARHRKGGSANEHAGTDIRFATSAQRMEVVEETKLSEEQIEQLKRLPPFNGHIPKERLKIAFVRASGPGGQNVNKVSTKCDVRFHVQAADWLPEPVRLRLSEMQATKINSRGELCVQASVYRTQEQNVKDAMDRIREMVTQAYEPPSARVLTIGRTEAGDQKRLKGKKKRSDVKSGRQKMKSGRDYYD